MRRNRAFLWAGLLVILLDQATKALVSARMTLGQSIPVVDRFFSLTYIRNSGIAFGLFNDGNRTGKTALLAVATMAAIAFLLWLLGEVGKDDAWGGLAVGMVSGGAIGNLIDRLRLGEVVDFLDVFWGSHHWPAFNAADSAITVGVVLLAARQMFAKEEKV